MSKMLEEKKNDLITRAETVIQTAQAETRELTEDERAELEAIKAEVESIKATLKLEDDVAEMAEMEKKDEGENPRAEEEQEENMENRSVEEMEKRAFEDYIRGYALRNDPSPVNMTKTANGAVIPQTVVDYIIRKVYDICPILDRSQKFNVKGSLTVPYYPADAQGINVAYQNEFSQLISSSGSTGSVTLTGFLAGALTKVSRSLINNSNIDIVAFVVDEMAYAIKRFIERELLIGTDDKVEGLSTLSNGVVCASASAITADEIIRLHDCVKDDFQNNAIWIMSPATRTAVRLLQDGVHRYMLQDDISLPFGTSLLGKPVYVSDNMPDIGDGGAVIYYGDFKGLATKFSEDINVQVLRERFADEHADGVIGWFEFDAKVINEQMIAKMVMAGSSL